MFSQRIKTLLLAFIALVPFIVTGCSESDTGPGTSDTTPPTITGHFPQDGATDVNRSGPYWVAFSEPMDKESVTDVIGFNMPGEYNTSWIGDTLLITPTVLLNGGTSYTITVDETSKDLHGNRLGSDYQFSFTTTTASDNTPPQISGTDPENDAINVNGIKPIEITFSEPMNLQVTEDATGIDPAPSAGWIEWEGLKMIIYHSSFPSDSLITVTVNTTATDLAGNHLEAACIFSYRTSIDNTSPRLVSASPSNGATGVPTSITQIVLNFSEPMDQTSFDYMPAENIDARIMREIVSEPEFSPDFSSLTVPLSGNLLSGCTYWVEFLDVTDGAGNYIDPRPTSYSFTTSGNVTCFPVKNEYCWYYIDNELTQFTRCIENYNQSSGTFDEVKYEGELKDEAAHLRKTSSEILHLGFSEYDDYGVLEQTIMWDDPLPYIKFPLENYLPSSWNFSTQTSAGPYTMYVNGTAGIDNKEDLIIDTDYIEGTFKDCYVHHLHVMVEIDSSGVNIGGFDHHQWMWLAPGAGPVRIITEDTENGEGPYVDTLTVYDWDL